MNDELENDEAPELRVVETPVKPQITEQDRLNHESNSPFGISNSKKPMVRNY